MIKEFSGFRIVWDVVILIAIIVGSLLIPLKTVYPEPGFNIPVSILYLIDTLFLIDIILNFFTTYQKRGIEISELRKIALHYISTYFFLDLIANIPVSYMVASGDPGFLQFLPVFRLLRLVRMVVILKRFDRFILTIPGYMRIIKVLVIIIIITHWEACAWFLVSRIEGFPVDSWVVRLGLTNESPAVQYLHSIYWTVITMTTIGYGDIIPVRNLEYVFATIIAVVGASSYAYIIANLASWISNLNQSRTAFRNKMEAITQQLSGKNIPPEVNRKIRDYYENLWNQHLGRGENFFLEDMPDPIRLEVLFHLTKDSVGRTAFFRNSSTALQNELLLALERQIFPPGTFISREGESGKAIYFITQGEMEIISGKENKRRGLLGEGDYFGELSLILSERKTASVRTITYCDVFILMENDFKRFKSESHEFKDVLNKIFAEKISKTSQLIIDDIVL